MNNFDILKNKFTRIGARLKVSDGSDRRTRAVAAVALDVRSDGKGEFFEVIHRPDAQIQVEVLDVRPSDRHLLLLVREREAKSKFLCGHDERHWFVAAIPEAAPVGTVLSAKEALKPALVREAQARERLRPDVHNRRKNSAYRRQGEWFFIPRSDLRVDENRVLRNEPITRGNGGKPHWCDFCYRTGGETVHVNRQHPNGILESEYRQLIERQPETRKEVWRVMRRNALVYVRGRVRHADHATITLPGWHRVLMNTENESKAMINVAFLD